MARGDGGRDEAHRPWSAAVLSPHRLREITDARPTRRQSKRDVPFVCSRPGSWIAATVEMAPASPLTAVAPVRAARQLSDASVHRSLSELSPVSDDPRYGQRVVLGGDLNTWTGWPANEPFLAGDRNLLQRFEALGLVDCLALLRPKGRLEGCTCTFGDGCTHTRTRRDPRSTRTIINGHPRHLPSVCVLAKCLPATSGSQSPTTPRSSPSATRTSAARCRLDRHGRSSDPTPATTKNSHFSWPLSRRSPEASPRMLDLGEIARLPPPRTGRTLAAVWRPCAAAASGHDR